MRNIIYILKRLKTMDKKAMFEKINSIHSKTKMSKLKIFLDMQKCARRYGAGYMDYDLFEMYNLTDEQRDTYLTRGRNNNFVTKYCDMDALHYFQNKDEFNRSLELLNKEYINLKNNLGRKKINYFEDKPIKKTRKTRWNYLAEATIGTLIRKDIYIAQIIKNDDVLHVNAYFFDVLNSQNSKNIILNYSICYTLFKRLFNCNIKLKFNYVARDEIAKINVVNKLTKDKIKLLLRANNLNELDWKNMNLGIIESDK